MNSTNPRPPIHNTPYPWVIHTRDIRTLWMMRLMFELGAIRHVGHPYSCERSRRLLRRSSPVDLNREGETSKKDETHSRLLASLRHLEQRAHTLQLPARLRGNMAFLSQHFSFNRLECQIFALAVCLRTDEDLITLAKLTHACVPARDIARVLGVAQNDVARALEPSGRLHRSAVLIAQRGSEFAETLQLARGTLAELASVRISHVDDLFRGLLVTAPKPTLSPKDYAHISPGFDVIARLVREALESCRSGVNILIHGAPGVGKSELARTLAHEIAVPLFDIASESGEGDRLEQSARLGSAATALFLLGKRRAVVAFDEVEAIFNDGSFFTGKLSTAESSKSWVNHLLESNPVPVIWIANSIRKMDPAFVRRFDLVVQLKTPPQQQRLRLLERECGGLVPMQQLKRLARAGSITPALITRASNVLRRVGKPEDAGHLLESILDGVLTAQGQQPLARLLRGSEVGMFDPSFCNASEDLASLARAIACSHTGRLCLYGPPGTGKTAFGHWLADHLGKLLVLKRVSDLQSPYLGEMEQNLARAFEQAARDDAVLQIDEVDSFLMDRRNAERHWEVSQVNEFLTQLESFEGVFIASTNLMDNMDFAALRRFDYKIRMDYLLPGQAVALLDRDLNTWGLTRSNGSDSKRLNAMSLTAGDFATVGRQHRIKPFTHSSQVVEALHAETLLGERGWSKRIGFV